MPFHPISYRGTLHHYTPRLTAFEHQPKDAESSSSPHHTILFLGGLGDGLGHPQYPSVIAQHLPTSWTIVEVLLSSSYTGWATSSLARDADEFAKAVEYFRSLSGRSVEQGAKVVIMGHSTGCQICMEYLVGPWKASTVPQSTLKRPKIDGVILQAGISDREALTQTFKPEELAATVRFAESWAAEGRGDDVLPKTVTKGAFGPEPSASRWVSLASRHGDDDYFSSDLSQETIDRTFGEFGRRHVPICIFLGEKDDGMPDFVDKKALISRWSEAVERGGGTVGEETCIVVGATHNLNKDDQKVKDAFAGKVIRFVQAVAKSPSEKL